MTWIEKVYEQLLHDVELTGSATSSRISRRKVYENKIDIILSVVRQNKTRELCIRIKEEGKVSTYPQWYGVGISIQIIGEYAGEDATYLVLSQSQNTQPEIFCYIAEDITKKIENLSELGDCHNCLQQVLSEWKHFFDKEQDKLLDPNKIQGLFGELLFLQELIQIKGASAISSWTGCNLEQHDFYIKGNAVEVKTTATKAPYSIEISSEYQLDPIDVDGLLFLRVYPLRKSESDGKTIISLVEDVLSCLNDTPSAKSMFIAKLEMSGYNMKYCELYDQIGFKVRDVLTYEITEDFPAIKRSLLPTGLSKIRYTLNTEVCGSFARSRNRLVEILSGGGIDAE